MVRRKERDREIRTFGGVDPAAVRYEPALALIDDALNTFASRTLVTGHEIVDFLLDLRNALGATTSPGHLDDGELISR